MRFESLGTLARQTLASSTTDCCGRRRQHQYRPPDNRRHVPPALAEQRPALDVGVADASSENSTVVGCAVRTIK